jgi:hypothetical protein
MGGCFVLQSSRQRSQQQGVQDHDCDVHAAAKGTRALKHSTAGLLVAYCQWSFIMYDAGQRWER